MRLAVHTVAAASPLASVFVAMSQDSFVPLVVGFFVFVVAEGVWLYFHFRR
jgi:hypothetical protein